MEWRKGSEKLRCHGSTLAQPEEAATMTLTYHRLGSEVQKSSFISGFVEHEYPNHVPYSIDQKQLMSESLNLKGTVSRLCITSMCEGTHGILGAGETAGWLPSRRLRRSLCESSETINIFQNYSHFGTLLPRVWLQAVSKWPQS